MVKKRLKETTAKRLERKEKNRILGGVAEGIADYFGLDANLVRIVFVLLAIFNGGGIILYLLLWILLPSEDSPKEEIKDTIKHNAEEIKTRAMKLANTVKQSPQSENSRFWIGFGLLIVGVVFLLQNFGFAVNGLINFWPVLLIIAGVMFIKRV